ncbi:patatin-like phospholipase family protein [Roseivirga sp. BDSF3-8]|uniref:patatin-like phospholipase family protein n=1 Tax=Roseivirga sp. BDSF3-8 TaxID=3241598 RepID=UPI0035319F83
MVDRLRYSFPVQLLVNNLKKNVLLVLTWVLITYVIAGHFGKTLGIPYLFLDPEYLDSVDFTSFFIVGFTLGGFTMAYHITCYILDGAKYPFLGLLKRPFMHFTINNSTIPFIFLVIYIIQIFVYQLDYEFNTFWDILLKVSGMLAGYFLMVSILFVYFWLTNKDVISTNKMARQVDKKLRKSKISRAAIMRRWRSINKKRIKVRYFLRLDMRLQPVPDPEVAVSREDILNIFSQHHLNSIIIEMLIFGVIMGLSFFADSQYMQIPAAASTILFATLIIMFVGAISFWVRGWALTIFFVLLIGLNMISALRHEQWIHQAFGLDYDTERADYLAALDATRQGSPIVEEDRLHTLEMLDNWRKKFDSPPPAIFICSSGGGQRAALWTLRALQVADSATEGSLLRHTILMTGASGGLVGGAYYRELALRKIQGQIPTTNSREYTTAISSDMLNPVIFSLLINEPLVRWQSFEYQGREYPKDRGYSFERKLNRNTRGLMDKSLEDYRQAEYDALIPMLLMTPTIINDGRKLYISSQKVSYMGATTPEYVLESAEPKGVDFRRLFEAQQAGDMSFLTALRLSATFPYVSPNASLPSEPRLEVMDAGVTDNFGITDAVRFIYTFRHWLSENTSGVIILSVRDTPKKGPVSRGEEVDMFDKIFTPLANLYKNFDNIQDLNNDTNIEYAGSWMDVPVQMLTLEYSPLSFYLDQHPELSKAQTGLLDVPMERASLSWRLTGKEKENILQNIRKKGNQRTLQELVRRLSTDRSVNPVVRSQK